ncbi:hypothetical protein [Streptomyces sp. NPDC024089]|uniref:hypothetical protein n=1 Tax=Streptomyces sp. NPDC024089 TaxID=3154328 RepID=UPI0033FE0BA7
MSTQREAEQAALVKVERREQVAQERAALVTLGEKVDGLMDSERLLTVDDEDADEAQIQAAAEQLRTRRPALFGEGTPRCRPPRATSVSRPGSAGLEMAKRHGLIPEFSDTAAGSTRG